jgi:outer membrane lipoprotein-sorting protein
MMGEFVQFGPRGEQTGGKFFIERPGKLRFDLTDSSRFQVVADGKNRRHRQHEAQDLVDLYPLSKTPLKLLLDERIDLSGTRCGVSRKRTISPRSSSPTSRCSATRPSP